MYRYIGIDKNSHINLGAQPILGQTRGCSFVFCANDTAAPNADFKSCWMSLKMKCLSGVMIPHLMSFVNAQFVNLVFSMLIPNNPQCLLVSALSFVSSIPHWHIKFMRGTATIHTVGARSRCAKSQEVNVESRHVKTLIMKISGIFMDFHGF